MPAMIHVQHQGKQLGPFTEAELQTQLASGAVSPNDYIWWEGQKDWVLLSQTPYGGSATPPPPMTPGGLPGMVSVPGGATGTSKLAVWSLVLGCLSIFLSLLASIPAIILGHMGLNQIKRNPGLQGGGMALAGLILGYIFTFLLPIISIIAISVLIALGNQVKSTFNTIRSEQATNSADQNVTVPDQSTNPPDSTTPAVTPDQSTNSAPAGPVNAPPVNAPSTNAPADSSTNAAPMSQ
jgi:hypothetical protein